MKILNDIAYNLNWIQNFKLNFNTFNSNERIEMQIGTKHIEILFMIMILNF